MSVARPAVVVVEEEEPAGEVGSGFREDAQRGDSAVGEVVVDEEERDEPGDAGLDDRRDGGVAEEGRRKGEEDRGRAGGIGVGVHGFIIWWKRE